MPIVEKLRYFSLRTVLASQTDKKFDELTYYNHVHEQTSLVHVHVLSLQNEVLFCSVYYYYYYYYYSSECKDALTIS